MPRKPSPETEMRNLRRAAKELKESRRYLESKVRRLESENADLLRQANAWERRFDELLVGMKAAGIKRDDEEAT